MSETLAVNPNLRPLTEEELSEWIELCSKQVEEGSAFGRYVSRASFDTRLSPSRRIEFINVRGRPASANYYYEVAEPLLGEIYDTKDVDELLLITEMDLVAFMRMQDGLIELGFYPPEKARGLHEVLISEAKKLILPNLTDEIGGYSDSSLYQTSPSYYSRRADEMESPALVKRIREGMPRQAQLVAVAALIPDAGKRHDNQTIKYETNHLKVLCDIMNISKEELRSIYALLADASPDKAAGFLTAAIYRPEVRELLANPDGSFPVDIFGGEGVLEEALKQRFLKLVEGNGGFEIDAWRAFEDNFDPELVERLIPVEERKHAVNVMLVRNKMDTGRGQITLGEVLEPYFDQAKFEHGCAVNFSAMMLDGPLKESYRHSSRPLSYHAIKLESELGIDLKYMNLWFGEAPLSRILEVLAESTTLDQATTDQAEMMREAHQAYSPELKKLLEAYTEVANDACFERLGQGYSYDDDPEWFDARDARARELTLELDKLKQMIVALCSQN